MEEKPVLYVVKENVAYIDLNRPSVLNSFNSEMRASLLSCLKQAASDRLVRAVAISGKGRAFSAGQDVKEIMDQQSGRGFDLAGTLRNEYNPIIREIVQLPKPVVAGVNGVAAGAGFSLAMACDIRMASKSASFLQAFSKVGLVPDSGSSFFLPRSIGYARAAEMVFNATQIDAQKALELGLVNSVVEDSELRSTLEATCVRLAHGPTKAYSLAKKALHRGMYASLDESLETEAVLQGQAAFTEDFLEGVRAFVEKRKPEFKGK
ncbi:MAG: enoyl-CoA hydratase-related protein [Thermoprotei archaeon]